MAKVDKRALLKRYEDNLANAKDKNQYLKAAGGFLENTNGLDRASIDQHIAALHEYYKPGTVNYHFRVIRRLFAVNALDWPYQRGEAPMIKELDEHRPQLGVRTIEAMIRAGVNGKLFPDEVCFLALATIYGIRRGEMANLTPADVNLRSDALYIATLKHGRERYHIIPPEIKPYLEAHDFSQRYGLATLRLKFKRILLKSTGTRSRVEGLGWHAIRRALFEGLIRSGVDPLAARKFMRWKSASGDMAMPARYYGNVVVEVVDMDTTAPVLNEAQKDQEIFEKHPFLPFWRMPNEER